MLPIATRRLLGPLVGLAILALTAGVTAAGGAGHASARLTNGAGQTVGWARLTEDAAGRLHLNVQVAGLNRTTSNLAFNDQYRQMAGTRWPPPDEHVIIQPQ